MEPEWFTRKLNRRKLSIDYLMRTTKNHVLIYENNSLSHELRKAEVCYYLRKLRKEFYTEAVFSTHKGRADIYITDSDIAIEIIETEPQKSIIEKIAKYPCRKIIPITTWEPLDTKKLETEVN